MSKLTSVLLASALLLGAVEGTQTYTGVITDTMCSRDHAAMNVKPDARCVRECVKGGHAKYALLDGRNVYALSDQQTPEKYAAQVVRVTGVLYQKTQIIKVQSIEPLGAAPPAHHH